MKIQNPTFLAEKLFYNLFISRKRINSHDKQILVQGTRDEWETVVFKAGDYEVKS